MQVLFGCFLRFAAGGALVPVGGLCFHGRKARPARAWGGSAFWRCRRPGKGGPQNRGAVIRAGVVWAQIAGGPPLLGVRRRGLSHRPGGGLRNRRILPSRARLAGAGLKAYPAGLTPRADAESGVGTRRPDSGSWQRGRADVPPFGAADRRAHWPEPFVPGKASSARWPSPHAAGAADDKESPRETTDPRSGPSLESNRPPAADPARTTTWSLGPCAAAAPRPGK